MIETNNLYYASYLLTEGLSINNVEKQYDENFKNTVVFSFVSDDINNEKLLEKKYISGTAEINIRKYLDNLVKIRDIMYNFMGTKRRITNVK